MIYISNVAGRNRYFVVRNGDETLRAYHRIIKINAPYFRATLAKFDEDLTDFERRVLQEATNLLTLDEPEARNAVITYDDYNGSSPLNQWVALKLNDMMGANPHMFKGKDQLFEIAIEE